MASDTQKPYDLAIFIGRFQPLHLGHCSVIERAINIADHVLVLVGSSYTPRSYRNPFLFEDRRDMILGSFPDIDEEDITVMPLEDCMYNDGQWVQNVQELVAECLAKNFPNTPFPRITLIGHSKDHTSFYLKLFPQWESTNVPGYESEEFVLAATDIRRFYFQEDPLTVEDALEGTILDHTLSPYVRGYLWGFMKRPEYADIRQEYEFIQNYKASWASAPYAPTFVTTDAVVVQSGHVLLVQRRARPGKGLWALPGGFINENERIDDAVIRELREETRIKVPVPVLKGSIVAREVFDNPHRSARGRTVTHGYLINLAPDTKLPTVKGGDDAKAAKWWPLAEVKREMMFEDHFDILVHFTSML